jgi:hypothetical protein
MISTKRIIRPFVAILTLGLLVAIFIPLATHSSQAAQSSAASSPTVTGFKGIAEGQALKSKVTIEASVSGSKIAKVVFRLDGPKTASYTDRSTPYIFLSKNWDTSGYPNGSYMLTATATDQSDRSGAAMIHFSIANGTQAPTPTTTPPATPTATPGNETPVAGQLCPAWVHDRYAATGPDGKPYPTWHPPTDPQYRCWFGHEHGSDPRKFPALAAASMPAFGYTAAQHGMPEPHVGFKVFVVDDHDRGLWWMVSFHQGSSGPARAFVHMHTNDVVVARSTDNTILANVHLMADTGASKPKCRMTSDTVIPGSEPAGGGGGKAVPTSDCTEDFYESWGTVTAIDTLFNLRVAFDIDNAVMALKRLPDGSYSQTEGVYTATLICPGMDPLDPRSDCNRLGDKRQFIQPRLAISNTSGNGDVWTDPMGKRMPAGQGIKQFLHPTIRINTPTTTNFANGVDGGDTMIYRAMQYCADTNNCNPRNFGDGTVRPPN